MPSKRILLIDDEPDIHRIAQIGLMMEAGWQMLTASSGDEGLDIAIRKQPDAILLDAMMPGRDGIATLEQLRIMPETQDIPVIFLTAKAQAASRRQFYALGAKGVITKPFDPTTLASQIAGFLVWDLAP
ncbi:MAG: response regulator [Cyanobacteria bacterium P01_A01_bin.123]